MITARNLTSHTYYEALADDLFRQIIESFYPAFESFTNAFTKLYKQGEE